MQSALKTLPKEQCEALLVHTHGELELTEIVALTRSSPGTAKSYFRYAVQKLRRLLTEGVAV